MRSTDCGSCKEKSIWVHPAAAGLFYWHIRWDIGGEIGLICFSCHLNGRSLSRGKALTGLRSQWANSQSSFIGFLLQTLCLMWLADCNQLPEFKKGEGWGGVGGGLLAVVFPRRFIWKGSSLLWFLCWGGFFVIEIFWNLLVKWSAVLKQLDDFVIFIVQPSAPTLYHPLLVSTVVWASCFPPWLRFHLEVNRCQAAARAPRRWQHN